ncbi:hypothetical protein GCM10017673_36040 [Streptosporangium violaceochromogenes]|nr:hypothetical protein GCM10017673_36040 [Streptosporangium violaceochromogenes]
MLERVTGIEPALSAWETVTGVGGLSWEDGGAGGRGAVPRLFWHVISAARDDLDETMGDMAHPRMCPHA